MRGFKPGMIETTMQSATYFSTLYYLENMIRDTNMFNEGQIAFLASAGARTVLAVVTNPLIVVKTRFEVVGFQEYKSVTDAFQ